MSEYNSHTYELQNEIKKRLEILGRIDEESNPVIDGKIFTIDSVKLDELSHYQEMFEDYLAEIKNELEMIKGFLKTIKSLKKKKVSK